MIDQRRIRRIKTRTNDQLMCLKGGQSDILAYPELERLKLYGLADTRFLLSVVDQLWRALGCRNADVENLKRRLDLITSKQ